MPGARFDRAYLALSLAVVVLFLFIPLFALASFHAESERTPRRGETETGVGVAVILRVAARRVLQTGLRVALPATASTFSRTSSRALIRRVMRIGIRSLAFLIPGFLTAEKAKHAGDGGPRSSPFLAVSLGCVALALSFAGVLAVVDPEKSDSITAKVPLTLAATSSVLPLLAYALLIGMASRWHGVATRWHTGLDGLVLQGYFTGAGSFLPFTTDVEYVGSTSAKARTSLTALGGLFALHWLAHALGNLWSSPALTFVGSMFLLYAFVYSFPIQPLDGHNLWARSKLLWFMVWIVLLASFVRNIPEFFYGIL